MRRAPTPSSRSTLVLAALASLGVGCTANATRVIVVFDTDLPADRVATITATATREGSTAAGDSHAWVRGGGVAGAITLPASFGVVPAPGAPDGERAIVHITAALAAGASGQPALTLDRTVSFPFIAGATRYVRVYLAAACGAPAHGCAQVPDAACTVAQLCDEGGATCGDDGVCTAPAATLLTAGDPALDATPPAIDASAADVPADAPPCPDGAPGVLCGGACVDTTSDVANCGACGAACTSGPGAAVACVAGACVLTCRGGANDCDQLASDGCESDPRTDNANCGACGHACAAGMVCSDGACADGCGGGTPTFCAGVCVASTTDANNCGTCGHACPGAPNASPACVAGACGLSCNAGFHLCDGACASDHAVATCGPSCSPCVPPANATPSCDGAACGFACNAGFHACGGACVSNNDVATCGASSCAACAPPAHATPSCDGTACGFACDAGYTLCGGACVDTQTDNTHCGACGLACAAAVPCVAGACVCTPGAALGPPDYARASTGTSFPTATAAQNAFLLEANHWRAGAGVAVLNLDTQVAQASQAHAHYLTTDAMAACWPAGTFSEVASCAGFTGATTLPRLTSAGYAANVFAEFEIATTDGAAAADTLAWEVYGRKWLLDSAFTDAGFGSGTPFGVVTLAARTGGATLPPVVVFPAPGQTGVPDSYTPNWNPAPPAPPTGWPSGPVVSAMLGASGAISAHSLWDPQCNPIPHTFSNASDAGGNDPQYWFLYANAPLASGARVTVRLVGTSGATPFDQAWVFTTR